MHFSPIFFSAVTWLDKTLFTQLASNYFGFYKLAVGTGNHDVLNEFCFQTKRPLSDWWYTNLTDLSMWVAKKSKRLHKLYPDLLVCEPWH